jgi:hypothetical protein
MNDPRQTESWNAHTESVIRELNLQFLDAMVTGNAGWFARRLAEEFLFIEGDGQIRDRASFVGMIAAGPVFSAYDLDDVKVRVYGDVAMLQATGRFIRTDGYIGMSRYVDIYVKVEGDWQVVSAQVTRLSGAHVHAA